MEAEPLVRYNVSSTSRSPLINMSLDAAMSALSFKEGSPTELYTVGVKLPTTKELLVPENLIYELVPESVMFAPVPLRAPLASVPFMVNPTSVGFVANTRSPVPVVPETDERRFAAVMEEVRFFEASVATKREAVRLEIFTTPEELILKRDVPPVEKLRVSAVEDQMPVLGSPENVKAGAPAVPSVLAAK